MVPAEFRREVAGPDGSPSQPPISEGGEEGPRAWEEIESGRYMPRRIRGSCRGRVLG
jgi:hypothetical protein